eukprot:jgi/Mesvir1/24345/Mv25249-RA.1
MVSECSGRTNKRMSREARERVGVFALASGRPGFSAIKLNTGTKQSTGAKRVFGDENQNPAQPEAKEVKRPGEYSKSKRVIGEYFADQAFEAAQAMTKPEGRGPAFDQMIAGFNSRAAELGHGKYHEEAKKLYNQERMAELNRFWVARINGFFDGLTKSDADRDVRMVLMSTLYCGDDLEKEFSAAELENLTGMDAKKIRGIRAIRRQQKLDYLRHAQARKGRPLPQFVIDAIVDAWMHDDESRASSQMKDVKRTYSREGRGNHGVLVAVEGARYYMTSKEDMYNHFLEKHAYWNKRSNQYDKDVGIHVGYTTFCKYAPDCIKGKWKERNLCACEKHVTMQSAMGAWTKHSNANHGKNCKCGAECAGCSKYREPDGTCGMWKAIHSTDWIKHFHCPVSAETDGRDNGLREGGGMGGGMEEGEGEDEWRGRDLEDLDISERLVEDEDGVPRTERVHRILKMACVEGFCPEESCGIHNNWVQCDRDKNSTEILNWFKFEMVEQTVTRRVNGETDGRAAKKVKRPEQVQMRSTPAELRDEILKMWDKFTVHCFTAWSQADTIKDREKNLREGDVLVHGDWAENYENSSYVQLQSQYFHKRSHILMPMIVRYRLNGELEKRVFFFLGDSSIKRGERALVYALRKILETLRVEVGVEVRNLYMCSDNCAVQFKSRYVINQINGLLMGDPDLQAFEFHYMGEQHGKGEVDGQGAKCKCVLREMQRIPENQHILETHQLVAYLNQNWQGGKTSSRESARARAENVTRHFFLLPPDVESGRRAEVRRCLASRRRIGGDWTSPTLAF